MPSQNIPYFVVAYGRYYAHVVITAFFERP